MLDDVSLCFSPGRFTAIVGSNGCGKSNLIKAIMGFLAPVSGRVALDGIPVGTIPRKLFARRIAYLPQENHCPDYITLAELVELGGYARYPLFGGPDEHDLRLFSEALATVGLAGQESLPVNALSGGQRRRAWIAMVLAQDAEIILFDEPVNNLDVKYQYATLELIRDLTARGRTVVAVLHDLNLTSFFADEVVMMREGRVMAHAPTQEAITAETVAAAFDFEADVFRREGRLVCVPRGTQP